MNEYYAHYDVEMEHVDAEDPHKSEERTMMVKSLLASYGHADADSQLFLFGNVDQAHISYPPKIIEDTIKFADPRLIELLDLKAPPPRLLTYWRSRIYDKIPDHIKPSAEIFNTYAAPKHEIPHDQSGPIDNVPGFSLHVPDRIRSEILKTENIGMKWFPNWFVIVLLRPKSAFSRLIDVNAPPPWLKNLWRRSDIYLPGHLRPPPPPLLGKVEVTRAGTAIEYWVNDICESLEFVEPDDKLNPVKRHDEASKIVHYYQDQFKKIDSSSELINGARNFVNVQIAKGAACVKRTEASPAYLDDKHGKPQVAQKQRVDTNLVCARLAASLSECSAEFVGTDAAAQIASLVRLLKGEDVEISAVSDDYDVPDETMSDIAAIHGVDKDLTGGVVNAENYNNVVLWKNGVHLGADGPTTVRFAAMTKEAQRQLVGEELYARVQSMMVMLPIDVVAKVTGIMLDIDVKEIVQMFNRPAQLLFKIHEVLDLIVYNDHVVSPVIGVDSTQEAEPESEVCPTQTSHDGHEIVDDGDGAECPTTPAPKVSQQTDVTPPPTTPDNSEPAASYLNNILQGLSKRLRIKTTV